MRFAHGIAICSGMVVVDGDHVCTESVITTASSQGFLGFIQNCLQVDAVGPMVCLSRFISSNASGNANPIPTSGACRDAYQALVTSWSESGEGGSLIDCDPIADGETNPNWECLSTLALPAMKEFYDTTEYYPMYPQCSSATVRNYASLSSYSNLVHEVNTIGYGGDIWSPVDSTSICDSCYEVFKNACDISDVDLLAACDEDPESVECMDSTTMVNARAAFQSCAGFDILTYGPVCTADNVASAELSYPQPYYAYMQCAYNPTSSFCPTLDAYYREIQASTTFDCALCYTEFGASALAAVTDDSREYCGTDVFSDECLAYNIDSLDAFADCSGYNLDVEAPTSAPATPAATTAATTAVASTEAPTEAVTTSSADTTTKPSGSVMGSFVLALLLAAL